jgi:hypothetical protein
MELGIFSFNPKLEESRSLNNAILNQLLTNIRRKRYGKTDKKMEKVINSAGIDKYPTLGVKKKRKLLKNFCLSEFTRKFRIFHHLGSRLCLHKGLTCFVP